MKQHRQITCKELSRIVLKTELNAIGEHNHWTQIPPNYMYFLKQAMHFFRCITVELIASADMR
jgi:hypothetical protein